MATLCWKCCGCTEKEQITHICDRQNASRKLDLFHCPVSAQGEGLASVGRGNWSGKEIRGWIQCKICVQMHVIAIMILVITILWMGDEKKSNGGGGDFKYVIGDTL
jgi:hypothetical protein